MTQLLLDLGQAFPTPNDTRLKRHLATIERMTEFYNSKLINAPGDQEQMFRQFINSLRYANATLKMYRKLTTKLSALAGETKGDL